MRLNLRPTDDPDNFIEDLDELENDDELDELLDEMSLDEKDLDKINEEDKLNNKEEYNTVAKESL
jgi:hypothetical protein